MTWWTEAQIEELKGHLAAGLSASQIGDEMGITRNAVISKTNRSKLEGCRPIAGPKIRKARGPRRRRSAPRPITHGNIGARNAGIQHRLAVPLHEPEPPPVDDLGIPMGQRKTLLELTNWTCRFPIGEGAEMWFCGGPADLAAGLPYCTGHTLRAYQPGRAPKVYVPRRTA